MSFLKKLGVALLRGVGIVSGLLPMMQPVAEAFGGSNKTFTDTLTKIGTAVMTAEVMIGAISGPDAKTGAQKLQAAAPIVAQIIQTSELMAGKKIQDEAAFTKAVQTITGGVADLLNSLDAKVHTTDTGDLKP